MVCANATRLSFIYWTDVQHLKRENRKKKKTNKKEECRGKPPHPKKRINERRILTRKVSYSLRFSVQLFVGIVVYDTGGSLRDPLRVHNKVYPLTYTNISCEAMEQVLSTDLLDILSKKIEVLDATVIYEILDQSLCIQPGVKKFLSKGKPYTEQKIGSCTQKCIQVWLHEELYEINHVYKKFRKYKLIREIKEVKSIRDRWIWAGKKTIFVNPLSKLIKDGEEKLKRKYETIEETKHATQKVIPSVSGKSLTWEEELARAVEEGLIEILEQIVERSSARSSVLGQILCAAATEGSPTVVKFCLDKKGEIFPSDLKRAFELAAIYDRRFILKQLYSTGLLSSNDVEKALIEAATCGSAESLIYLIAYNCPPEYLSAAIKKMAEHGCVDEMEMFLSFPNIPSDSISNAYLIATAHEQGELVKFLESKVSEADRNKAALAAVSNG